MLNVIMLTNWYS